MRRSPVCTFHQVSAGLFLTIGLLALAGCESMPIPLPASLTTPDTPNPEKRSREEPPKSITTRGPKKRIAVLPFEVKASNTYGYSRADLAAAEMLTTELFKTGEFIVVERAKLEKVFKEQSMGFGGFINPDTAAKASRVLGVQALVTGAVTHMGIKKSNFGYGGLGQQSLKTNADLDIRVIDTTTAKILLADTGKGAHSVSSFKISGVNVEQDADRNELLGQALRAAAQDVAQKIVAQMEQVEWSGLIAQIKGKNIYVNAGKDLGLATGNSLAVFRPGMVIKDPATGESLGREETQIGRVLVTNVGERFAVAESQSGLGFKPNDVVRLAQE